MKNLLLAALLFCGCTPLFAQDKDTIISFSKLSANVHVYVSYGKPDGKVFFPANGLFIVTDSGIVVIDTPWTDGESGQLLDSLEKFYHQKVVLSISTHYHADRTGGLDLFKQRGVKTYSSAQTSVLAGQNGEKQPEFTFTNDTTFRVGHTVLQTYYPGAGHTADNIVVWLPATKILFGGCLVKSEAADNLGYMKNADVKAWPASIRRLQQRYPQAHYVIPGHQEWTGNPLQHTLDLLKASQKEGK